MKIGGFILALLVTSLSIIHCCSFDNCGDETVAENKNEKVPDEGGDSCSPFLNCGSCAGFTVQNTSEENNATYNSPKNKTAAHYRRRITGEVINTIWQPPRLS